MSTLEKNLSEQGIKARSNKFSGRRRFMRLAQITLFIIAFCLVSFGQTNKGSITGTVTDTGGAVVKGATVTITNVGTNKSVVLTTSDEGSYTASTLDPSVYNVKVESPNFKTSLVQKVKVDTASVATVNVVLSVGSVSEQVTITADTQMVNSESGTISQTITERQLRDLPLNNRSVLDLAVTMPNVSGDAGSEDVDAVSNQPVPGFNLSVNGGRPGSTSMLADGVNNTGIGIARSIVSFTPETVQEFSVQSSAYSAEYGTTGGGVINITTKSGTNQFSGTALWYTRNPKTNAAPWRQGTAPRPPNNLRTNQVSFTVGGPIYLPKFGEDGKPYYSGKNKSFFFFAYEPRWRTDFVSTNGLLPTDAERSGNFRGLVRTSSGFLPAAVAAQFGQTSVGQTGIFQQFSIGPGGRLIPIVLTTGFGYCQFGSNNVTMVQNPLPLYGGVFQPQCSAIQVASQTEANNPNLNIIPSSFIDPISMKVLPIMDQPGSYFLDNAVVRNFFQTRSVLQNETRYTLRLDHNITDNMKANFRYTKTPAVGIKGAGGEINGNTGTYSDAKQYLVTINNVFSSSLVNDLRLNYTRGNFSEDFSPQFSIKTGRNYSSELGLTSLTTGGMPLFLLSTDNGYVTADLAAGASTNNFNVEQRKNISDTLYWTHGNQAWKFGTDLSRAQLQVIPFFAASGGRWNFRTVNTSNNRSTGLANGGNDLASFLIGVPNSQDFRPALFTYNYQWDSYAFFAQDDWKIKPNLTLNLGVRYSLQLPRTEANNQQGVFRPDLAQTQTLTDTQRRAIATASGVQTTDPIPSYVPTAAQIIPFAFAGRGGRSRYIVPVDKKGFEPRLGFAWSPKMKIFGWDLEKRSFVVRGGFGVSHFPITGNNRSANPDFGGFNTASTLGPTAASPNASTGGVDNTSPIRFTGNNALQGSSTPLDTLLGTDANGLVFLSSLAIPGVAVDFTDPTVGKVPYSENWNLAIQFEPFRNSTIEIAYVGNRGVHLYTPQVNISNRDYSTISILTANNINPATNVTDPLGRRTLLGAAQSVSIASLYSTYLGFDPLNKFFNAQSSSIRHAAYIDFRRRIGRGLNLTANYTFAKSMDDSSDASPDVRVLTTGSVRGQISLGGTLKNDRGLSSFDVKHAFNSTFTYDLPFGKGRHFFKDAPWYVNGPLGGWTVTGIFRVIGGNPYQPFLTDANALGSNLFNRVVRPDIVPGVPLKNPLWNPSCRTGSGGGGNGGGCEPYLNPAAFMRPVKGQLGNAPRSLTIRAPFKQYLDLSVQKDFPMPFIGKEGKRRINFRVDALNVLNHPAFAWNNLGNTPIGMGSLPTEFSGNECISDPSIVNLTAGCPTVLTQQRSSVISTTEYDAWATFNGRPLSSTPAGAALLGSIRANADALRLPPRAGQTSGAMPDAFFHVQLPQGFGSANSLSYDITTLPGFKLYRLRQNYDGNFGTLTTASASNGRYIQFGIRLIF